jgi:hypothetical protein
VATGGAFTVRIAAVDNATKTINNINKALAGAQAPVKQLHKAFSNFANLSGISKGFELVSKAVNSMVSGLLKIAPALGILTGGGIIAGLASQVRTWSEYAAHLQVTSHWLGILPGQLQTLQNANRLLGGSAEAAAQAYEQLDDALQDAVAGRNTDLLRLTTAMGLNIRGVGLSAKSATEVMPQLMDKIKELNDSGKATPAIMRNIVKAFHLTPEMVDAAKKGGWAEWDRLQKQGTPSPLTEKETDKLTEMYRKTMQVTLAMQNFGLQLALALEPLLGPAMDKLQKWFGDPAAVKQMAQYITDVVHSVMELANKINDVVQATVGWKGALEILGVVLAIKILAPVISLVTQVGLLTKSMFGAAKAAEAMAAATEKAGVSAGGAAGGLAKGGKTGALTAAGQSLPFVGLAITIGEILRETAEQIEEKYHVTPQGGAEDKGWEDVPLTRKWFGKKFDQWFGGGGGGGQHVGVGGGWQGRGAAGAPEPSVPYQPGSITSEMNIKPEQYTAFKESVAGIEKARYDQMGGSSGRFAGRYQMGEAEIAETAARLGEKAPTRDEFLHNKEMQERYFEAYTAGHHKTLMATSEEYRNASPEERLKILAYAHNQGAGGAATWLRTGRAGSDAFGTSGKRYYNETGAALAKADQQPVAPSWYKGPQTTKVEGGIKVDINNNTPNSVTASSSGGLLSAPRVMQPMSGYV